MGSQICWSSADDENLINFVRNHEILYNVKNKDHRKTHLKQILWCEVGKILNKTESDCYKRWCYVRDYYIRRKGKPGICSTGEAAKKRADLLSFLDTFPSSRHSTNILEDETREHTPEQLFTQELQTYQDIEVNATFSDDGDCSIIDNNNSRGSTNDEDKESLEDGNKRNLKRNNSSQSQERLNLLKQIVHRQLSGQNEFDENDLFFTSMAKIVKKLPRHEQAQIRMQVGSLVGNAELRCISSNRSKKT